MVHDFVGLTIASFLLMKKHKARNHGDDGGDDGTRGHEGMNENICDHVVALDKLTQCS